MAVVSILDNDLYKFSMGYGYMKEYPNAEGEFEFHDRNNTKYSNFFLANLIAEIEKLGELKLTQEEKEWAIKTMPYIPQFYWEWLSSFRFEPDRVRVWLDGDSHLHITVCDKLYRATLYEVPILAIVAELSNKSLVCSDQDVIERLVPKIALSNEKKLYFSEFGTRRRFNQHVQDIVVEYIKKNAIYCTGTSNVHLAMKYDMKPIGTVAHEWFMFHGAVHGYRSANNEACEAWVRVFDGSLGIALTDTYGSDAFFKTFSQKHAKLYDGLRQDSGDEFEYTEKAIACYKRLGVDPRLKTIVYSNALDFPKLAKIVEFAADKIQLAPGGIGTNLTNDTGFKAPNIVMKLMKCRKNADSEYINCIKISDDAGKVMGDPVEVEKCFSDLGIQKPTH